jgi:UDP-2-acetamido-3-amino-2,3-dideoxy-glucuronate N-acetyltransferase
LPSFQHPTSIIDHGATIGQGTKIWHFAHISAGALIGKDCILGQNVFIANKVVIGNRVKIQNNVSVYDCVTLEDEVFCGPSMVFTNVYNPRAFIERKSEYKNTLVKRGATLGANCTILCGLTIGEYAFIGAGTFINEEVPAFALYVGSPGKQIGWMSKFGERMDLPLMGEGKFTCPYTGDKYELKDGLVYLIPS